LVPGRAAARVENLQLHIFAYSTQPNPPYPPSPALAITDRVVTGITPSRSLIASEAFVTRFITIWEIRAAFPRTDGRSLARSVSSVVCFDIETLSNSSISSTPRETSSLEEYDVTRQAGTERAFSSQMCSLFEPGTYSCLCCDTVPFDASEKFESGKGWPSFAQPIAANAIAYRFDGPSVLKRVETICNTCDAHLGHVFPDGPAPGGLRYCMNAVALKKASKL
jgi:peptide-methionine (R)-S-oxide reductase